MIVFISSHFSVYIESVKGTRITKAATVGDVLSLFIDFDNNKGFFRKNGEKCHELNLNPASLGFYPCIGMCSTGEAVQIMEKAFWEPEGTSVVSFKTLENKLLYLPCLNVG